MLQNAPFKSCESIIIYCTRQQETNRIASLLRTCLTDIPGQLDSNIEEDETLSNAEGRKRKNCTVSKKGNKRRKVNWSAECYHAGMQASRRRTIQSDFMSGRLRIVVATVAFGMGLNKSDVRAIIHYNLPKNFESFVQEIGRAGRDGHPAYCHVFIDQQVSHDYSSYVGQCHTVSYIVRQCHTVSHIVRQCHTVSHIVGQCHTVSHSVIHCRAVSHSVTHCKAVSHSVTHCRAVSHSVTHCRAVICVSCVVMSTVTQWNAILSNSW